MPKIPEYEATQIPGPPGGAPQFREQQFAPVQSIDQAMAPGRIVGQKIGDALTEFSDKLGKAQQASQYANLSVAATKELHETQLKYHLDTDYGTLTNRYAQEAQGIVSKYLDQATDQEVKNHLTIKLGTDYASGITSIGNVARRGVVDQLTAETLSRYEERKRIAASQTNEFDYGRTVAEQMGDIDGMIHAGVIKAEEGQKLKSKFRQDVEALQINKMKFNDPHKVIQALQDPNNFPNASPEYKQRALENATTRVDMLNRTAISQAERAERQQEKGIKAFQVSNFAKLAQKKDLNEQDVYDALENRLIDESQALKLNDRRGRDVDADIQFADKQIDAMFRTEGPLGKFDSTNESYRSQLKRELHERSFSKTNPENPMVVLDDIFLREKDTYMKHISSGSGKPVDAMPRPRFLTGEKNNESALNDAKKRTVEAFRSGQIDQNTFDIEARKLSDLEMAFSYQKEKEGRQSQVDEKTKAKSSWSKY